MPALMLACGGESQPTVARLRAAVTSGETTNAFPSVGQLVVKRGNSRFSVCSGNLISDQAVLTARHCVVDAVSAVFVVAGRRYDAVDIRTSQPGDAEPGRRSVDLALLELHEAPGVEPTPIARLAPRVGTPVRIVGFGTTHAGQNDAGIKRQGANVVADVTASHLVFVGGARRASFCNGDSGGPTFASVRGQYVQVGVHSAGGTEDCGVKEYDERIDRHTEWLLDAAAQGVRTVDEEPGSICDAASTERLNEECVAAACSASGARGRPPLALLIGFALLFAGWRRRRGGV